METIIKYNRPKGQKVSASNIVGGSINTNIINGDTSTIDVNVDDKLLWKTSEGNMSLVPKNSYNYAEGESSIAIGTYTETSNEGEFAIGTYNDTISGETLFTIGNGTSDANRSNLIQVGNDNTIVNNNLSGTTAIFNNSVKSPSISGNSITANNASITSLTATAITSNTINVTNKLTTNQLEAVSGYIKTLLSDEITVDYLTVTKAAHFFKLIIDEIKATQGQIIITPCNAVIDKVETVHGNYRCYFRAKDEDKEIYNNFEVNDQVVCQTFNAATGTSYDVTNTFYWRLCVGTGTTTTDISGETVDAHYIDLSDSDKDQYTISEPQAGDNCVQLGNRTDNTRQAAIVISAYNSEFLDKGIKAPSIVQYFGINDYNLSAHRRNVISKDFNEFIGSFKTSTGDDIEELIEDITSGNTAYLHTAWANSSDGSVDFTKNPNGGVYSYIGFCTNHTESDSTLIYTDYSWSYNKGSSGDDAEFYKLVPSIEKNVVDKNGTLGVQLQYQIAHVSGNSVTTVSASENGYWVRFRRNDNSTYYNLSIGTTYPTYTNDSFIVNYHKQTTKPTYMTAYLVYGTNAEVKDQRIINVIFNASATLEITDEITATVQGQAETISSHTNSISTLNQNYNSLSSTVSSHTNSINTLNNTVSSQTDSISQLQQTASALTVTVANHTTSINNNTSDISSLKITASGLSSSVSSIRGEMQHKNYFSFNRGIKPYNTTCLLYPYGYGFIGWGSLDRICNFGFTDENNDDWTLVFTIKASSTVTVTPKLCNLESDIIFKGTTQIYSSESITATTQWETYRIVWEGVSNPKLNDYLDFIKSNNNTIIYLKNIALVKGSYYELQFEEGVEDVSYQGSAQPFNWTTNNLTVNDTFRGLQVYQTTVNPTTDNYIDYLRVNNITIKDKTPYTLSFWAKSDIDGAIIDSYFYNGDWNLHKDIGGIEYNSQDGLWTTQLTTEWKHYTIHWFSHVYSLTGVTGQALIKNVIACRLTYNRATANRNAHVSLAGVTFQEGWVGDGVSSSSSLIQQTSDSIEARVNDVSLRIDGGQITLNGNTQINGQLSVTDEDGIILQGNVGGTTQVLSKSIGTYYNFINQHVNDIQISAISTENVTGTTQSWSNNYTIGSLGTGTEIILKNHSLTFMPENSGTIIIPSNITTVYYIYVSGTQVKTFTVNGADSPTIGTYTLTSSGNVNITMQITATFATAGIGNLKCLRSCIASLPVDNYSVLGYDGYASNFATNRNVYFGHEQSIIRYNNYGIRVNNEGLSNYIPANGSVTGIETWLPIGTMQIRSVSNNYTINDFDGFIYSTNNTTITITLPSSGITKGKMIWIKKRGNGNVNVNGTIFPANSSTSTSSVNVGGISGFIFDGSFWNQVVGD